jgi:hypothetical protein
MLKPMAILHLSLEAMCSLMFLEAMALTYEY